jgi:hypothetical protein
MHHACISDMAAVATVVEEATEAGEDVAVAEVEVAANQLSQQRKNSTQNLTPTTPR